MEFNNSFFAFHFQVWQKSKAWNKNTTDEKSLRISCIDIQKNLLTLELKQKISEMFLFIKKKISFIEQKRKLTYKI